MSLSGRLEEFSPADLLRIVGSSRSSGRVELTAPGRQAMIFFDHGQVVGAISSAFPVDLAALLRDSALLAPGTLEAALQRYQGEGGGRLLGEFLVEACGVDPLALDHLVRRQVERIVIGLFPWDKGRFTLEFGARHNLAASPDNLLQFIPRGGINPDLLIEEAGRSSAESAPAATPPPATPPLSSPSLAAPALAAPAPGLSFMPAATAPAPAGVFFAPPPAPASPAAACAVPDDSARRPAIPAVPMVFELDPRPAPATPPALFPAGLVGELHGASSTEEVYSLVLSCAAWTLRRAVLFVVQGSGLTGWGQVGLEPAGAAADLRVRGIRIPEGEETLFRGMLRGDGLTRTRPDPRRPWDGYLFNRLEGEVPAEVLLAPLRCGGRLLGVLYGDQLAAPLPAATAVLETFLALAGLRLEMAALERRLADGPIAAGEGFRLDFAR